MRVKELNNKLAHVCWSPYNIYPSYVACGTTAEQIDTSSSSPSVLELLKFDLSNPSTELEVAGQITAESRFSKLIWGEHSSGDSKNLIIGGCEDSKIYLYDYERILEQDSSSALVKTLENHTGKVSALDQNPFQHNLLASGASQSEILIWDLNNSNEPMTPGAKIQPADDINCVAWNKQVQHILASTCSGKCVVWDLRKNESIIKVSDNMSKMKAKLVAWHPDIATQMCLSSEDDNSPYLQIWDLRFATSPVRILEGHQRGILNFSWCSSDSNLLVSSSRDNRILCWNPNNATTNGEILYELPTCGQWCFDVSWSQRNPDLICTSSFESQINVYSLMGGQHNVVHQTSSKIMDSFGVDSNAHPTVPTEVHKQTTKKIEQLKLAPKWMRRTCGAKFGFGGKLVQFGKHISENQQNDQIANQRITISQVVTDPELVDNAQYLESILKTGNLIEYCNYKIEIASDEKELMIWKFILATFSQNKSDQFIELLGFTKENLTDKMNTILNGNTDEHNSLEHELKSSLDLNQQSAFDSTNAFDQIAEAEVTKEQETKRAESPVDFSFKADIDEKISKALILGQYKTVVDLCIKENRFTDAILVASFFDKDLFAKTQKLYFQNNQNKLSKLLEGVLNKDWSKLISSCNLDHWKEALATIMTYTTGQEASALCDQLGSRLENAHELESNLLNACICYICSANLDNLSECWQRLNTNGNGQQNPSASLQDLIEKVMTLRYSLQNIHTDPSKRGESLQNFTKLNSKIAKYAKLLTDQGCFLSAYSYINDSTDSSLLVMKDRIYKVLDPSVIQQNQLRKPESPFVRQPQQNTHQGVNRTNGYPHGAHSSISRKTSYNSPTAPSPNIYNSSPQPNLMPGSLGSPNHQNNTYNQATPIVPIQAPPPLPSTQNPIQDSGFFQPSQPQPAVKTTSAPQMPSYMHTKAPTGWNDPPVITPKIKAAASSTKTAEIPTYFQPAALTSSMPSGGHYQPNQFVQNNQPNQMYQPPSYQQNLNQGYQPNSNNNMNFQPQSTQNFQPQPTQNFQPHVQQRPASVVPEPEPVKVKGPIPAENQIIKTTFDTLLSKCLQSTNAPIVRRKLDDVGKKLEVLYDKLRDSTLSDNVIQGLNTIIQQLQLNDHQGSISMHSQLVAHSNFSEISGFMPGIKVLIQSCQQLGANLN